MTSLSDLSSGEEAIEPATGTQIEDGLPREEGGQRWYHLYPDAPPKPGEPLTAIAVVETDEAVPEPVTTSLALLGVVFVGVQFARYIRLRKSAG